ncbi:MAG: hypothetical protein JSR37_05025 [Verrucomicrobia bacterium]|nr:hypothetical protein [Verrucomicrobiota bacterium]MBS0636012.1 hypothetical protein [Verrucomicrobiota bacterium]
MTRILFILLFFLVTLEAKEKYDQFPKESCTLAELKEKANELQANNFSKAKKLLLEIRRRVLKDPKIRVLTTIKSKLHKRNEGRLHHPFDKNRLGKQIKDLYINASDVRLKDQNFILSSCPRSLSEVRDYFDGAIARNTQVFVSCLKSTEVEDRRNNFWQNKVLKNIRLRDGSKLSQTSSRVLKTLENSKRNTVPQIIESRLLTSKGIALTHLHYEGWKDKTAMPSEKLLNLLLDRIYELSPDPKIPVAINCKGGVGRTGTVAISLYLRRVVDRELKAGKPLNTITVNIPEIIYMLRKERKRMVGIATQLTQIYTVLYAYYERLKEETDHQRW